MFFFGNFDQNVGTSFRTVVYEEMKWFSKSDIASCQIKIWFMRYSKSQALLGFFRLDALNSILSLFLVMQGNL
mgnify:CR=1 FL=1